MPHDFRDALIVYAKYPIVKNRIVVYHFVP